MRANVKIYFLEPFPLKGMAKRSSGNLCSRAILPQIYGVYSRWKRQFPSTSQQLYLASLYVLTECSNTTGCLEFKMLHFFNGVIRIFKKPKCKGLFLRYTSAEAQKDATAKKSALIFNRNNTRSYLFCLKLLGLS